MQRLSIFFNKENQNVITSKAHLVELLKLVNMPNFQIST